jgi:hypothetical protein
VKWWSVDPLQQRPGLGQLGLVDRGRLLVELLEDLVDLLAHRAPVVAGGPDVAQDPLDRGPELVQHLGLALAVDLEVQVRLAHAVGGVGGQDLDQPAGGVAADGDHRVDGQVDDQAVAVQLHGHESTRNGMSSVTISTIECLERQPCSSNRGL